MSSLALAGEIDLRDDVLGIEPALDAVVNAVSVLHVGRLYLLLELPQSRNLQGA